MTGAAVLVIVDHLKSLACNLKNRFADLKQIDFPTWVMQPMLENLSDVLMQCQEEFSNLQNDESVETLFSINVVMAWFCDETQTKFSNSTSFTRKLLLQFLFSYLAESGFSAVTDLLLKKRNRLSITKRGDLRLKLT